MKLSVTLVFLIACIAALLYAAVLQFGTFDWHGNVAGWLIVAAALYVASLLPWEP